MMKFGFVEQSKPQTGGGNFGKFGLNQAVEFVDFKFNPNGGAGESAKECIDFTFKVGEQEFRHRIFPFENAFEDGKLKALKDFENKDLALKLFNNWQSGILDIARCFVDDEVLKKSLVGERVASFKNFALTLEQLIKRIANKPKLDVFLEWQKKIPVNQEKTFLTFAVSEGEYGEGICIVKHIEGDFKEVKDDKGLKYVNENGDVHPISRNAYYFRETNKKANRQELKNNTLGSSDPLFTNTTDITDNVDNFDDLPF